MTLGFKPPSPLFRQNRAPLLVATCIVIGSISGALMAIGSDLPQVEDDRIDGSEAVLAGHLVAKREVGLDEDGPVAEARQLPSRDREGRWIDVETEKAPVRGAPLEDGGGVTARAHGAVEVAAATARPCVLDDLST